MESELDMELKSIALHSDLDRIVTSIREDREADTPNKVFIARILVAIIKSAYGD
jgi:hypothetical protein